MFASSVFVSVGVFVAAVVFFAVVVLVVVVLDVVLGAVLFMAVVFVLVTVGVGSTDAIVVIVGVGVIISSVVPLTDVGRAGGSVGAGILVTGSTASLSFFHSPSNIHVVPFWVVG
jgi:hypothetical protein